MDKAKKKKTRGAGRPEVTIDWNFVDDCLRKDVNAITIAEQIGVSVDTFYVRCKKDKNQDFSAYRQQKLAEGADKLKETAYDMATGGDKTMLIFLLKNRAGYADRSVVDQTTHLPEEVEKRTNDILDKIEAGLKELDE